MEVIREEEDSEHVFTKQLLVLHRQEKKKNDVKLRENSKILIETLHQSEEESGMTKISKYFTRAFLTDITIYYREVLGQWWFK